MSSFDQPLMCSSYDNAVRRRSIVHSKYPRCPSYLIRVAPPKVYSSDDMRNVLVPKTYEVRKMVVSSTVTNGRSRDRPGSGESTKPQEESAEEAEDAESTERKLIDDAGDGRSTNDADDEIDEEVDDLSTTTSIAKESGNEKRANSLNGEDNERLVFDSDGDDWKSKNSFGIPKINVIDETRPVKNHNSNVYGSTDNSSVFYDFDDHEKVYYVNKSSKLPLTNEKGVIDKIQLIRICRKCRLGRPINDFSWEDVSETDKIKLLQELI